MANLELKPVFQCLIQSWLSLPDFLPSSPSCQKSELFGQFKYILQHKKPSTNPETPWEQTTYYIWPLPRCSQDGKRVSRVKTSSQEGSNLNCCQGVRARHYIVSTLWNTISHREEWGWPWSTGMERTPGQDMTPRILKNNENKTTGFINIYANSQKNIWQDPHSMRYLPCAPADPLSTVLQPAPCPGRLTWMNAISGWPCLPANAEHQHKIKGMEENETGVFILPVSIYGVSKTGHSPQPKVPAPFKVPHSLLPGFGFLGLKVRKTSLGCCMMLCGFPSCDFMYCLSIKKLLKLS